MTYQFFLPPSPTNLMLIATFGPFSFQTRQKSAIELKSYVQIVLFCSDIQSNIIKSRGWFLCEYNDFDISEWSLFVHQRRAGFGKIVKSCFSVFSPWKRHVWLFASSHQNILLLTLTNFISLAPKVLLDYLRPMITIQSHPTKLL